MKRDKEAARAILQAYADAAANRVRVSFLEMKWETLTAIEQAGSDYDAMIIAMNAIRVAATAENLCKKALNTPDNNQQARKAEKAKRTKYQNSTNTQTK